MLVGRGEAGAPAEDGGRWRDDSFGMLSPLGSSLADGCYLAGVDRFATAGAGELR